MNMYEPPYEGTLYQGLPINKHYPMSERYLSQCHAVYRKAFEQYSKVMMFHVTLRLPIGQKNSDGVMSRFMRSLKGMVARDLQRKRKKVDRVHDTDVLYAWCREFGGKNREHYHVYLLVNANTYRSFGCHKEMKPHHLSGMIRKSWSSALGIEELDSRGLVHFPDEPLILSTREIPNAPPQGKRTFSGITNLFEGGFYWMSYLCKLTSKQYQGCRGEHNPRNFGCSSV